MIAKRDLFGAPMETISNAELDTLIKAMNDIASFDPHAGTINEMMNSGSIRVIKNEHLRRLISSWSSYLDEVREEENLSSIARDEYVIPYLMENAAMADWMSIGTYGGVVNFKNYHEGDKSLILSDRRFENLINYSISRRKWSVLRYTAMQEYLQEMIDLIQSELNGSNSPLN
ncbi:MAG: hypothetical protein OEQ53_11060 [Saprospiraceae bacterium]|nr:hypothetical protein [Saprospiraceae bacterium]